MCNVSLDIGRNQVLALIGPSGCGKSTFLRCLNRMNDTIRSARVEGEITLDGQDIYDRAQDVAQLRARVGIVSQKPTPFPHSIYANVAYGPKIHGLTKNRADLDELVTTSLQRAGLWDEVKDRLSQPGTSLSGGQQQRLCIARTIAVNPEVILMDEPTSALDPIASARIEDLIDELRANYAIIIVTHNMQQAARVSQRTAYFHLGDLVEIGPTDLRVYQSPAEAHRRLHHGPVRLSHAGFPASVTTGRPAAFHAAMPPPMCAACCWPAPNRRSAAVRDRLPLPQWKTTRRGPSSGSREASNVDRGYNSAPAIRSDAYSEGSRTSISRILPAFSNCETSDASSVSIGE